MLSICPLVSRLSLAARTGATRILMGTSGIDKAKRTFSVKGTNSILLDYGESTATISLEENKDDKSKSRITISFKDKDGYVGDDGSGESQSSGEQLFKPQKLFTFSLPPGFAVSKPSDADLQLFHEWTHLNQVKDAFVGGRHGKLVPVEVSRWMDVPSGILPCSFKDSEKEEIYRLYEEDPLLNSPEELAKAYGTCVETIYAILVHRRKLGF